MVYLQHGAFLPDKLCSNCRNFQVSFEITTSTIIADESPRCGYGRWALYVWPAVRWAFHHLPVE